MDAKLKSSIVFAQARAGVLSIILTCFPHNILLAQTYKLSSIPSNFSFSAVFSTFPFDRSDDIEYSVTLLTKSNGHYSFERIANHSEGTSARIREVINDESDQLVSIDILNNGYFIPHDCPPSLQKCEYFSIGGIGPFLVSRIVRKSGEIWITDRFIEVEGSRQFQDRICISYDQYGFWKDFVILNQQMGRRSWAARTHPEVGSSPEIRIEALWGVCEQLLLS